MNGADSSRKRVSEGLLILTVVLGVVGFFAEVASHLFDAPWLEPYARLGIALAFLGFLGERFVGLERSLEHRFAALQRGAERVVQEVNGASSSVNEVKEIVSRLGVVRHHTAHTDLYHASAAVLNQALAGPARQLSKVRVSQLSGYFRMPSQTDTELLRFRDALATFFYPHHLTSEPNAKNWQCQWLIGIGDPDSLDALEKSLKELISDDPGNWPKNWEVRVLVRHSRAAMLSAIVVGEVAILRLEERDSVYPRSGIEFRGGEYVALFEAWFDGLWNEPGLYTVYSADGFSDEAFSEIKSLLLAPSVSPVERQASLKSE